MSDDKKPVKVEGPASTEDRLAKLEKWAGEVSALITLNGWSNVPALKADKKE